ACRCVNGHGVIMCLPSPISITVAIVVVTGAFTTTVSAKLGFDSAEAQYECCAIPPSAPPPATKQEDTIITVSSRQTSVVLESVTVPCVGGASDVLYEWCMPEDAPASMMFVGDTWLSRTAVVVGVAADEALYVQQERRLQQSPTSPATAEERARFVDAYEEQQLQQPEKGAESRQHQPATVSWTFLLKTTCRSTNVTATQRVRLRVEQDESDREAVELLLAASLFNRWTVREREQLQERLTAALTSATLTPEKTRVVAVLHEVHRLPLDGRWRVVLHAEERDASNAPVSVVRARDAAGILRASSRAKNELRMERIEMRTCHLSCSGQGVCDSATKRCVCEAGWLPSPLSLLRSGGRVEDCSWSTMTMASFLIVLVASVALLVMATRKHKSRRSLLLSRRAARRRQRYEHLRSDEGGVTGGVRYTSRTRKRSGNGPTLVALPPRSWSSSSLSSDECGDLVPIRRGAP
ncbi:hypothetical protein PENTCL1PPCAC_25291, partial [Pristionchus entomophagus]